MRVLIVEDDESIVRATKKVLERHRHEFQHVHTLAEALKSLISFDPDAIILDLGLPDSFGLETAKKMRSAVNGETLIIVYTANDAVFPEISEIGIDEFLNKGEFRPYDMPTVLKMARSNRRLNKALDRHKRLINGEETTWPGKLPDSVKIADRMLSLAQELKLVAAG